MYLLDNPVLQRELTVNLRTSRSFVLLLLYQALLSVVVYFAWPQESHLDLTSNPVAARRLVDMFFLGQYMLASLMAPSFAAGSISGEKERHTYEMLLASPLRPAAIVLGKLLASLTHLAILIFASLPIVMLCLPLGGVSPWEVMAAYLGLLLSVTTFGMISIACSSFFKRTSAALVVSYVLVLPLALAAVQVWILLQRGFNVQLLLTLCVTLFPAVCLAICTPLFILVSRRLMHPPDVGSEGNEVVDIESESRQAIGLVIQPNQFPDRWFAPPRRGDFLPDGANPIYDKEIHSEIFSQGTLMLRIVIQGSMFLAIPIMAATLFIFPQYSAWYIAYVMMFNMLVGPVFSAGAITSERERQTLDLILTTTITPWQILWGKLVSGLRISSVLTFFLLWPLLLACLMIDFYWSNLFVVGGYLLIVLLCCVTTAMIGLFCSVLVQKTVHSMASTYSVIMALFCVPLAVVFFANTFYPSAGVPAAESAAESATAGVWDNEPIRYEAIKSIGLSSPFAATFSVPTTSVSNNTENERAGIGVQIAIDSKGPYVAQLARYSTARAAGIQVGDRIDSVTGVPASQLSAADVVNRIRGLVDRPVHIVVASDAQGKRELDVERYTLGSGQWTLFGYYVAFTLLLNGFLLLIMQRLFNSRWRVATQT